MDRFKDRLKSLPFRSRSRSRSSASQGKNLESARPATPEPRRQDLLRVEPPPPRPASAGPLPSKTSTSSNRNAHSTVLAPSSLTSGNSNTAHDALLSSALSEAVEIYRASLEPKEREAFENAHHTLTDTQLSDKLRDVDKEHADSSVLRKGTARAENTLGILKRLTSVVSAATSADPIAIIVLGTVRAVFDVALGILSYFTKLSEMIAHFVGIVDALSEWPETIDHKSLHNAMV